MIYKSVFYIIFKYQYKHVLYVSLSRRSMRFLVYKAYEIYFTLISTTRCVNVERHLDPLNLLAATARWDGHE